MHPIITSKMHPIITSKVNLVDPKNVYLKKKAGLLLTLLNVDITFLCIFLQGGLPVMLFLIGFSFCKIIVPVRLSFFYGHLPAGSATGSHK